MIALRAGDETVFTVLGAAARRRDTHGLVIQLVISAIMCVAIMVLTPQWWSVAFLAGWSAAYAAWGLTARIAERHTHHERPLHALLLGIATLGTVLAVSGILGLGLAFYSGNAAGIKNACGKGSTNKLCQAWQHPPQTSRPIP
ncbi:MAG TPA: hypothetical protein VFZ73_02205 [Gemmatimonadaceae bacterium]